MHIRTPTRVERWLSSDGQEHQTEEAARQQEVFLSLLPEIQRVIPEFKGVGDRAKQDAALARRVVLHLASKFDFVPRDPARPKTEHAGRF